MARATLFYFLALLHDSIYRRTATIANCQFPIMASLFPLQDILLCSKVKWHPSQHHKTPYKPSPPMIPEPETDPVSE
ncbi:hypothetical protein BJX64DRAFT_84949 [Aspergillus heterothallicus]